MKNKSDNCIMLQKNVGKSLLRFKIKTEEANIASSVQRVEKVSTRCAEVEKGR